MGSSGIRAGVSTSQVTVRTEFDFLGEWWAKHSLSATEDAIVTALRDLPKRAGFPVGCHALGGGFSVWRLAADTNATELAALLKRIYQATGVPVLIIPQYKEGAYGYFGSRKLLGKNLTTSHVLDMGGGSLQISGEKTSFGDALGQKIWHRMLCEKLRKTTSTPCSLQPLSESELAMARTLLDERLQPVREQLSGTVSMTAISRPVSRGVLPVLRKLANESAENAESTHASVISHAALTQAIEHLAPLSVEEMSRFSESKPPYVSYLISDMLLIEGLLRVTDGHDLNVTEIDLNNLPGLLDDEQAFAWGNRYDCYLSRLRGIGERAYDGRPDCL